MAIRVLIVDDHPITRRGLRVLLELDEELEVVGEADNGRSAIEQTETLQPDVVVMDLVMPGMDGIDATAVIHERCPNVPVLVLSGLVTPAAVLGAVRAGAIGWMSKMIPEDQLRQAIKDVACGHLRFSPDVADFVLQQVHGDAPLPPVTSREMDVLRLLVQGYSNSQIGRRLGIGSKTVKTHVSSLLAKLGASSRTEAAVLATRLGLLDQ